MASRPLSTISCRTMRARLAPSAARSARSRSRRAMRASSRLATLAQAISSTKPTAPISTPSAGRMPPVSSSRSGTSVIVDGRVVGGMLAAQLRLDGVDVGARRFERDAGLQPADRLQMLAAAARVGERGVVADRRPHVGARVEALGDQRLERRRHHADDRERQTVHRDRRGRRRRDRRRTSGARDRRSGSRPASRPACPPRRVKSRPIAGFTPSVRKKFADDAHAR